MPVQEFTGIARKVFSMSLALVQYLNTVRAETPVDGTGAWQKHQVEQLENSEYGDALLDLRAWTSVAFTAQISNRNDISNK